MCESRNVLKNSAKTANGFALVLYSHTYAQYSRPILFFFFIKFQRTDELNSIITHRTKCLRFFKLKVSAEKTF